MEKKWHDDVLVEKTTRMRNQYRIDTEGSRLTRNPLTWIHFTRVLITKFPQELN